MSGKIKFCFGIASEYRSDCVNSELDAMYQTLKKFCAFLYANPKFSFFWSFSGVQLEYYAKKRPEFIALLSQLVNRKQSELLGGGYYEPMLPILLSVDRTGQIEEFTAFQRKIIGKRPTGIWMPKMWDSKIIDSLKSCGIEYVLLDSELLSAKKFSSFILENTGKTVYALPVFQNLVPVLPPAEYLQKITAQNQNAHDNGVAVVMFTHEQIKALLEQNWFQDFLALCEKKQNVELITPAQYFKESIRVQQTFIPPVMKNNTNIYEYVQKRSPIHLLYSKMIHVSALVNQCRGDKNKKHVAREKLWQAQAGIAYHSEQDFESILAVRKNAYHNLIMAEKLSREITSFYSSLINFDANSDGSNEYIYQFDSYNALITKKGGSVYELDIFKSALNYADTHIQSKFFPTEKSGAESSPPKHIFVDRLVDASSRNLTETAENDAFFANAYYAESFFNARRKEFRLTASALFGQEKQKVTLMKNYQASEHGLQVQYILKNESETPLKAFFVVESSLSIPFTSEKDVYLEVIADNQQHIKPGVIERFEKKNGVSTAVFTDTVENISFMFETNEEAGFIYAPVCFQKENAQIPYAVSGAFSWKIDLMPNMETEKIISLNIVTPPRQKRKTVSAD